MDYLLDSQACVAGDPDDAIEMFKAYEATGCDVIFCLLNPYNISHEAVMTDHRADGRARHPRVQLSRRHRPNDDKETP